MKYYITQPTKEGYDYHVVTVNPIDDANFLEDYGHTVITSGSSLQEALQNLEQVKQQPSAS